MRLFYAHHPLILWTLLLIYFMLAGIEINTLLNIRSANRLIAGHGTSSEDIAATPPEVIYAKAYALNNQGRYLDALRLYAQIENDSDPLWQERARYNIGSAYLQQVAQLWNSKGVWEAKQIHTLLDLAEQSLRQVVAHNPQHWQARYNLEFAQRIRPPAEQQEENNWEGHKSSAHAVMPGRGALMLPQLLRDLRLYFRHRHHAKHECA